MQQCRCDLCIVSGILIWILKKLILSIYLANFAAIKYTSLRLAVELFCWGCYKHGYYYFVDEWTSAVDTTNTCAEGYALWGSLLDWVDRWITIRAMNCDRPQYYHWFERYWSWSSSDWYLNARTHFNPTSNIAPMRSIYLLHPAIYGSQRNICRSFKLAAHRAWWNQMVNLSASQVKSGEKGTKFHMRKSNSLTIRLLCGSVGLPMYWWDAFFFSLTLMHKDTLFFYILHPHW